MRIDVHAHFLPRNCFDVVDNTGKHYGPGIVKDENGREVVVVGGIILPIAEKLYDPATRIKDMDATGVDMQVISPIPTLLYYNLDAETALWFARRQNDEIARVVSEYPNRFIGLATVPLQEAKTTVVELDKAINKLKMRGVEILSNVNGRQLDSPELMPFYKEAEVLDVPVYIHPWGVTGAEKMKKYYLHNLIGNPLDTTMAAAHLIFGGVLEKFPRLKFYLSHAGGNLPYIRGRFEHGYQVRPECKAVIQRPPSYYFPLLYFDTITHFTPALEYLVASVGADKVMMGTDYPYDMGDFQPVVTVLSLPNVCEADKQKILGGNAARLFKL